MSNREEHAPSGVEAQRARAMRSVVSSSHRGSKQTLGERAFCPPLRVPFPRSTRSAASDRNQLPKHRRVRDRSVRPAHAGVQSGFTLVEAMVVLAITAVLAGLAAPATRHWTARAGVADAVEAFMASITYARAEALRRGLAVTMCRSVGVEAAASPNCSESENWASGWIVFVDVRDDGRFDPSDGDRLLRVHAPLSATTAIRQNVANHRPLRFSPLGLMKSGVSGFAVTASADPSARRMVCVGLGGRARVVADPGAQGCAA
ncbi:MAG: prepilin-type N-terminal cleavage/methylation domain-containing protein [Comamonadaceae bacterium]|nr:MAG: prepilin-type N-terminal cleavage/methylation domain-containing protein [Comamonadaceae bacterium]